MSFNKVDYWKNRKAGKRGQEEVSTVGRPDNKLGGGIIIGADGKIRPNNRANKRVVARINKKSLKMATNKLGMNGKMTREERISHLRRKQELKNDQDNDI